MAALIHPEHEAVARFLLGEDVPDDLRSLEPHAEELDALGPFYSTARRRGLLARLTPERTEKLRAEYATNVAGNLRLAHDAKEVVTELTRRGLGVAPLKGAHLLLDGCLEDEGARPMVDIDVLTKRSERRGILEALRALSYSTDGVGGGGKHLPPYRRGSTMVEVHEVAFWAPSGERFGLEELRAEAEPLSFTLVHLLHHLYVSSVRTAALTLKTLLDVASITRSHPHARAGAESLAARIGLRAELAWLVDASEPAARFHPRLLDHLCEVPTKSELDRRYAGFFWKALVGGPGWFRREVLSSAIIPNRATMEAIYRLSPGSRWVYPAYVWRPLHLVWRAASLARGRN